MRNNNYTKYYYSFSEIIGDGFSPVDNRNDYLKLLSIIYPNQIDTANITSYSENLINIIVARTGSESVIATYEPISNMITSEAAAVFIGRLNSFLSRTRDKYETRISLWDSQKNNLLETISSAEKSIDNDTPQTADYDTSHASFVHKRETETDGMTIAERLSEIDGAIREAYTEWSNAFITDFVLEDGDEYEKERE